MTPIELAATHLPCRCPVSLVAFYDAWEVEKWYRDRVICCSSHGVGGSFPSHGDIPIPPSMIEAGAAEGKKSPRYKVVDE